MGERSNGGRRCSPIGRPIGRWRKWEEGKIKERKKKKRERKEKEKAEKKGK